MRSRVVVMGHPLHPMLISFPFAFLTGALMFDAAAWIFTRPSLWITGSHLAIAGVAAGVLAAVPGLVDFLFVVPPRSSAWSRALKHLVVNASALVFFTAAWLVRVPSPEEGAPVLVLEIIGAALLGSGGWMGGTLVYRNQIAVDHRYAHAGKWREESVSPTHADPERAVRGARAIVGAWRDELKPNQMKLIHVGGRRIVLARTEDGYAAFDDRCTHRGGSLADGATMCGKVQCPWHGSQFDGRTGQVKAGPAQKPIGTYAVTVTDDDVIIHVEGSA